eukprot:4699121-Pleurochrysis_carterae.AAC.1
MASTLAAMVPGVARLGPTPRHASSAPSGSDALHPLAASSPGSACRAVSPPRASAVPTAGASAPVVARGPDPLSGRHTSLPHSGGGDGTFVARVELPAAPVPAPVRAARRSRVCPCALGPMRGGARAGVGGGWARAARRPCVRASPAFSRLSPPAPLGARLVGPRIPPLPHSAA